MAYARFLKRGWEEGGANFLNFLNFYLCSRQDCVSPAWAANGVLGAKPSVAGKILGFFGKNYIFLVIILIKFINKLLQEYMKIFIISSVIKSSVVNLMINLQQPGP